MYEYKQLKIVRMVAQEGSKHGKHLLDCWARNLPYEQYVSWCKQFGIYEPLTEQEFGGVLCMFDLDRNVDQGYHPAHYSHSVYPFYEMYAQLSEAMKEMLPKLFARPLVGLPDIMGFHTWKVFPALHCFIYEK